MSEENNNEVMMPNPEELIVSSSPHIHLKTHDINKIMLWVILALMPAAGAGVYFFGMDALKVMLLCIVFCVGFEALWCKIAGNPVLGTIKDLSAVLTGLLLAMNLSAGVPWWICLVGAFLAICLGKQVFGGLGSNPFNPALVARVGLLIAFPKFMTTWVPTRMMTGDYSKAFMNADGITCATPLGMVKTAEEVVVAGGYSAMEAGQMKFGEMISSESFWNYFTGNMGGCLGETSALALLIGGLFLIAMKLIKWQVPFAYIGTVAVFTGIANAISPTLTPEAVFHIITGGLMLGAFFMATDMVTSPMTTIGAVIFGIGCGVITSMIRIWGNYPEGVSFSILIMNALVPLIDRFSYRLPFGYKAVEKGEATC